MTIKDIRRNTLSGITVGIVALPLSMALAIASGVAPQYGLYTAIIAGIVTAISGSSRVNISGPTAAFVVILLPITQQFGFGGLLMSGLLAGIILVVMGFGRMGTLIELVPYPVTIGFTSGIATVIATIQIKDFMGLHIDSLSGHYISKLTAITRALPTMQWEEILIASITFCTLVFWSKLKLRVPAHLIALIAGASAAFIAAYYIEGFNVATIGSAFSYNTDGFVGNGIPPVSPRFTLPWKLPDADGIPIGLTLSLISSLLGPAFAIAMLGAIESLLCAVVADSMAGTKTDPNRELIGQGIGNIIVPFFGGIPATAAIARTAMNIRSGGTMPLSSVIHALFIIGAILMLAPVLAYIPMASMAAMLMMVAWNMSEARHFIHILKVAPRHDVMVLLTCYFLTVLLDMEIAVAAGMALAAILFIKRTIELTGVQIIGHSDAHTYPHMCEAVMVYDINGPMFFGAAQNALKTLLNIRVEIKVVILDMRDVSMMDMTAIVAMESIIENFRKNNIGLVINGMNVDIKAKLKKAGVINAESNILFYDDINDSINKSCLMAGQIL
ncbi:MAG: C4-dicarboxylic acid transporter DauA [Nitrospira sp.]|nr:C4-dicarboxylic acid transporter DauA [Nitrospira sp.]